jgi:hypothetical protein
MTPPLTTAAPKTGDDGRRELVIVALLCLPAILGGLVLIAALLMMWGASAYRRLDRLWGNVFAASVLLYSISPLTTLAGIGLGGWTLRRRGMRTKNGKAIAVILGLAVGSSLTFLVLSYLFFSNLNLRFD